MSGSNVIPEVDVVVGNSSSGILEVPSLKTPTVNIGDRQKGRVQAKSVIKSEFKYISDAGFGWKLIGNIDSNDIVNSGDTDINSNYSMLNLISLNSKIIISSHPHRWSKSYFAAVFHLIIFKTIRFTVRLFARIKFLKKIMSKFYYLAKKI